MQDTRCEAHRDSALRAVTHERQERVLVVRRCRLPRWSSVDPSSMTITSKRCSGDAANAPTAASSMKRGRFSASSSPGRGWIHPPCRRGARCASGKSTYWFGGWSYRFAHASRQHAKLSRYLATGSPRNLNALSSDVDNGLIGQWMLGILVGDELLDCALMPRAETSSPAVVESPDEKKN